MSRVSTILALALALAGCGEDDPASAAPSDTGCEQPLSLFFDADGDGFGVGSLALSACEAPPGFVATSGDCDDISPAVHPGATEACNGVDDDCDGRVDPEGTPGLVWTFRDEDGDARGAEGSGAWTCGLVEGRVASEDDCDDAEPLAWTDADEVCGDGIDNDCDGGAGPCVLPVSGGYLELGLPVVESGQGKAELGAALLSADLTGDGQPDLIAGAPAWTDAATGPVGAVGVLAGPLAGGTALYSTGAILLGETGLDGFGTAVALPGDMNGDGYDDLLMSAPLALGVGMGAGELYAVFGPVTGAGAPEPLLGRYIDARTDEAGARLVADAFAPDGARTLVADATRTASGEHAAVVLSDGTRVNADGKYAGPFEEPIWISGESPTDDVGGALASVGDLDGDGASELAVGAPGWTGGGASGAVGVFLSLPEVDASLSSADILVLADKGERCGHAIAAGDVDGDGTPDLALACERATADQAGAGGIFLFLSPAPGVLSTSQAAVVVTEEEIDEVLAGTITMGDLDGDGLADLAAPRHAADRTRSAVHLWSGGALDGQLSASDASRVWRDDAGASDAGLVRFGPDLTGDATPDLITGWPTWTEGSMSGLVVVLPGTLGL